MRVAFLRMNDMNMKTLLSLSLLALPFFTAQVNAEPVALPTRLRLLLQLLKRLFRLQQKLKNKL